MGKFLFIRIPFRPQPILQSSPLLPLLPWQSSTFYFAHEPFLNRKSCLRIPSSDRRPESIQEFGLYSRSRNDAIIQKLPNPKNSWEQKNIVSRRNEQREFSHADTDSPEFSVLAWNGTIVGQPVHSILCSIFPYASTAMSRRPRTRPVTTPRRFSSIVFPSKKGMAQLMLDSQPCRASATKRSLLEEKATSNRSLIGEQLQLFEPTNIKENEEIS